MSKFEQVLTDLKEILLAVEVVNKADIGRHRNIEQETTFVAAYILPDTNTYTLKRTGTGISSYDGNFYVRILLNIDNTRDDLFWIQVQEDVINGVLYDKDIWNAAVNRDVVSVVYDDYGSMPKSSLEILFEFIIREDCLV